MKLARPSRRRPPTPARSAGTARVDRRTRACCPGCGRVTSPSSTTSTSTGPRPGRWPTRASPPWSTPPPMISGRYPNLGPEVLAEAGVVLVDGVGAGGLRRDP